MSEPRSERLEQRRRWIGAAVGVGGVLLLASLVLPWFEVRFAGSIDREGFFLIFSDQVSPAVTGIALAALGVVTVLAGACSALGWQVPRPVHIVLTVLLVTVFVQLAWALVRLSQLPRVSGAEELVAPSAGLFFALAGPLIGAAGSLALAVGRGSRRDGRA